MRVVLVLVGLLLAGPATVASAAGPEDLTETWTVAVAVAGSGPGSNTQSWAVKDAGGALSGTGEGGVHRWTISGSNGGGSMTATTAYTTVGYSATFTGTVSPDGTTITGTWNDTYRANGTWTGTRAKTTATIAGTVLDEQDEPVAGVVVTASGGRTAKATTGPDGAYELDVAAGDYTVKPANGKEAFRPKTRRVKAVKAKSVVVDFVQESCPAPAAGQARAAQTCKVGAIDWAMPDRLSKQIAGWSGDEGLPKDVYPGSWTAELFVTEGGAKVTCARKERWRWEVEGRGKGKVVKAPKPGCSTSMKVDRLGTYDVTAILQKAKGARWVDVETGKAKRTKRTYREKPVVVRDWLIGGFGDSNGSGEGNPPFAFEQCDRSTASYQWRVADYVEDRDPRSSVTMVWPACSGAVIEHLISRSYRGITNDIPLRDQVTQATSVVARGRPDGIPLRPFHAAIVSAGVNNIGFAAFIKACTGVPGTLPLPEPCEQVPVSRVPADGPVIDRWLASGAATPTLGRSVFDLIGTLPKRYEALSVVLKKEQSKGTDSGLGLRADRVFATHYPDFTTTDGGGRCGQEGVFDVEWPESTWTFIALAGALLNREVSRASVHGWTIVPVDANAFAGHGYCAQDSWFRSIPKAVLSGNREGAFHPLRPAVDVTARATRRAVCAKLYGNAECDGEPPAKG